MITWFHKSDGIMEIRSVVPGKFFLDSSTGRFASVGKGPKMYRQGKPFSFPSTLEGQCCFVANSTDLLTYLLTYSMELSPS